MPRNPDKMHCEEPGCRAWAVRESDPPRCIAHAPGRAHTPSRAGGSGRYGAPEGNQNARSHGFYSQLIDRQELADLLEVAGLANLESEVAIARVALRRLIAYLTESADLEPAQYARLAATAFHGVRTVARLLRDYHTLAERSDGDRFDQALNYALDALSEEWGIEL